MAEWGIELNSNDPALLSYLINNRQEPSWIVKEVEGKCYLISSDFQDLTNAEEVKQRADELLYVLNGIVKFKFIYAHLSRTNNLIYIDDHGNALKTTNKDITFRANISAGEQYFHNADGQSPSIMETWVAARKYPEVEETMRHYANQTNWFNLFKVYEVIEHDVDKATLNKWVQGRAEDFTYSANNARVSGYDARHSSAKFPKASSRRTAMSLPEATEFITNLLIQWLRTKH